MQTAGRHVTVTAVLVTDPSFVTRKPNGIWEL
jgi:hypothetical protein